MDHTTTATAPPAAVLAAWELAPAAAATPLGTGLINQTWLVQSGGQRFVLQRVNGIFPGEVNADIAAVTDHLRARGVVAPRLVPAVAGPGAGRLWVEHAGGNWRLMSFINGVSLERLSAPPQAVAAGQLLGRFHRALDDFRAPFHSVRAGVHDTPRHLANLAAALEECTTHPQFDRVAPLGREILALAMTLPPLPPLPERVVHGDPKIANLLFEPDGGPALALVDLDTVGRMPLPLELGDAFRSWCNAGGEEVAGGAFSVPLFRGAVRGYARATRGWITADEAAAIVPATLTIYVELAARFCTDALRESYFGWDPRRFASRSEHNQVRARSQVSAARSLLDQRAAADAVIRAELAPA
jgi:Ser/Thr protein kinase RdoA (MazF antagonist)